MKAHGATERIQVRDSEFTVFALFAILAFAQRALVLLSLSPP
jgi:hypothetical protein